MFGKLGTPEILLILVVFILIFGAKRLPDMARSLGQSMRILKSETKAMRDREEDSPAEASPAAAGSSGHAASERSLRVAPAARESADTAPDRHTTAPR